MSLNPLDPDLRALLDSEKSLEAGAASTHYLSPRTQIVYVDRPAAPATASAAAPATATATASAAAPAAASASERIIRGDELAAERSLLDIARVSLANGDPAKALEATDRHARQFPHGVLTEEREAVAIKALVAAGRIGEAESRAARFRERYPNSVLLHSVESSIRSVE